MRHELGERKSEKYRTIWSKIQWHNWKGLPPFRIALHVCSRTVHELRCVIFIYHVSINSTLFFSFRSVSFGRHKLIFIDVIFQHRHTHRAPIPSNAKNYLSLVCVFIFARSFSLNFDFHREAHKCLGWPKKNFLNKRNLHRKYIQIFEATSAHYNNNQ